MLQKPTASPLGKVLKCIPIGMVTLGERRLARSPRQCERIPRASRRYASMIVALSRRSAPKDNIVSKGSALCISGCRVKMIRVRARERMIE